MATQNIAQPFQVRSFGTQTFSITVTLSSHAIYVVVVKNKKSQLDTLHH